MKGRTALVVLGGMVGLAGPAAAEETTFCNFFITSLPRVITTQGHYCFDRNLSTAITTGIAITIDADFVVLDLNNFKLGGGSAGLGTQAVGIAAFDRSNITIRNGNIRGFRGGIFIEGGSNILIENNVVDGNTERGLSTRFTGTVVVRNNIIANTGGTTTNTNWTYGIYANFEYGLSSVSDNVVTNTFQDSGNNASGIYAQVADHNLVKMGAVGGGNTASGINADVCRDNTVLDNTTGWGFMGCTQVGDNYTNTP